MQSKQTIDETHQKDKQAIREMVERWLEVPW